MKRQIGIEISSTAVRVASVARRGGRTQLVGWGEAQLREGAVADGGVVELDAAREALVAAARAAKVARKPLGSPPKVRLAVSGLRAITRQVELPAMPPAELEAAAQIQAFEVVPFPPERTLLTARRLAVAEDEASSMLIEAAHRDVVEPLVAVVTQAGFLVEGVELSSSALARALAHGSIGGTEAIVSIGAELTTLVVHEAGEVRFVRTISAGGATVTRALATALEVSFADAEALKARLGATASIASTVPAEAVAAARDASSPLLSEIRSSIIYYSSLPGAREVARVVLVGGGALLAGLGERLQFQMAAPVVHRSCLELLGRVRVNADAVSLGQRGAVAIGLALADPAGKGIEGLLPPEVVTSRRNRRLEKLALAGVGVVLLAAAAGGAARYVQVRRAEQGLHGLRASIRILQGELPSYNAAQAVEQAALADERLAQPLVSHEVPWPAVLHSLGASTPPGVSTTSFAGAASSSSSSGTSTTPGTATPTSATPPSPSLPSANEVLGTLSLSLSAASYPGFRHWFNDLERSRDFQVAGYSGLTSSSSAVNFTAQIDLTGMLHTTRLQEFERFQP